MTASLTARAAKLELAKHANPTQARVLARFFKAGPGEYAAGDRFLGVTVPQTRRVARHFRNMSLSQVRRLLHSPIHEERLLALVILVEQTKHARDQELVTYVKFFLGNLSRLNHWDLIDGSAPHILGRYLFRRRRDLLVRLARSKNLWRRRVAILSTFYFIRQNDATTTIQLAKILIDDSHDLIHKAVGWMLREVGRRDPRVLWRFLDKNAAKMPATMLRYAIEKQPQAKRRRWMSLRQQARKLN